MSEVPCIGPMSGSQQGLLDKNTLLGSQCVLLKGKEGHNPAPSLGVWHTQRCSLGECRWESEEFPSDGVLIALTVN